MTDSSPIPADASALEPSAIERHAPILFAAIGVAMVVVAAVGYLADVVGTAFAVVGAGLIVVGGLSGRLLTFKLTTSGVEATLAARQALAIAEKEAEAQREPEQAAAFRRAGEALDDWWLDYLASPLSQHPNPYTRAAALRKAYQRRKAQGDEPGGS